MHARVQVAVSRGHALPRQPQEEADRRVDGGVQHPRVEVLLRLEREEMRAAAALTARRHIFAPQSCRGTPFRTATARVRAHAGEARPTRSHARGSRALRAKRRAAKRCARAAPERRSQASPSRGRAAGPRNRWRSLRVGLKAELQAGNSSRAELRCRDSTSTRVAAQRPTSRCSGAMLPDTESEGTRSGTRHPKSISKKSHTT